MMRSGDDGDDSAEDTASTMRSADSERRALMFGCGRCAWSPAEGAKALDGCRQERMETAW